MHYEYKLIKRVEFAETDMAGIMHFSNFFRYMEMAEHAFFRSLGFSIHTNYDNVKIGWPRVHVEADFLKPLIFEDEVEVHLLVAEKRQKSISYQFTFRKLIDGLPGAVCAHGKSTAVCAAFDDNGHIAGAVPIPAPIAEKIEPAPSTMIREERKRND